MPSQTNEVWEAPPPPRTHYLPKPGEQNRDPERPLDMGKSVCGYFVEPYEVEYQDFTRDSSKVTCETCIAWLAAWAERRLKFPKPGYGR